MEQQNEPTADAVPACDIPEALLSEHRDALARMRASAAVDMLIDTYRPRDADVVRRLLGVDCGVLAQTQDENGVPDTREVRERLTRLKRDCGYLFCGGGDAAPGKAQTVVRATPQSDDPDDMSDEDYYRTFLKQ